MGVPPGKCAVITHRWSTKQFTTTDSLENHTGAIEYYGKALAIGIDPHDVHALTSKGVALGNLGNHTGAIEYYDKALALNPKYERALLNKGYDLYALGNHSGAILYYDKALAIDPHYVPALNNKGADLDNLGNYTGAIKFYNKTLAIDPNNTFALTNKDVILHMLGNNTTPENATYFLEYENSTYGIKMRYPSDWSVEGGSNPAVIASFYPPRNYASYVMIQIENSSTGYTPAQYLNSLMLGDAADYKDYPDIRLNQNTSSSLPDIRLNQNTSSSLPATKADTLQPIIYKIANSSTSVIPTRLTAVT